MSSSMSAAPFKNDPATIERVRRYMETPTDPGFFEVMEAIADAFNKTTIDNSAGFWETFEALPERDQKAVKDIYVLRRVAGATPERALRLAAVEATRRAKRHIYAFN